MKTSKILALLALAVLIGSVVYAASTLTGSVHVAVEHNLTLAGAIGTPKDLGNVYFQQAFTAGTSSAAANVDTIYYAQRTLASGATENLDLAGTLTNTLGETVTFGRVKGLYIRNRTTTQTITVGNGTNYWGTWCDPATATLSVPPSGAIMLMAPLAGWTVTADTGDILKILNSSGATLTYDVWIIGTSAT